MNTLILLAAGSGTRINSFIKDKACASLKDKSVLLYSLEAFAQTECFHRTVIVYRDPSQKKTLEAIVAASPWKTLKIDYVNGGESRADSVYKALHFLAETDEILDENARVAIHDVARPLIRSDFIEKLMQLAGKHLHVVPANKLVDSIKEVEMDPSRDDSGQITKNLERSQLRSVQTPQIFNLTRLFAAYNALEEGRAACTDDASILEASGETVHYLENPHPNPKITTKSDWDYILYLLNQNAL
ncbi:MAG: hypothetical protein CML12_04100 [Puniceicoccaceae bacterium]|nr:hypothetical protein [Puniceicoccaceae bacterium]RCL30109.1 MAG: 2-C-methyl-D-erythritol 4-phosphate cytidylyltransferase [Puniceicoccaceae bacterium]